MRLVLDQGVVCAPRGSRDEQGRRRGNTRILAGQNAIVVTLDAHFHPILAVSGVSGPSVIRLRLQGLGATEVAEVVQNVLAGYEAARKRGSLVTVKAHKDNVSSAACRQFRVTYRFQGRFSFLSFLSFLNRRPPGENLFPSGAYSDRSLHKGTPGHFPIWPFHSRNRLLRPNLASVSMGLRMTRVTIVVRGVGAALISAVIAIAGFVLVGAFLPMWIMVLLYGGKNVESAPAHGGAILLATLPIAGVLPLCAFWVLTPVVYRRVSPRTGNRLR
jgi:hypothetical protein